MSNDILDEVEKYTGPRTCPECGHQIPFVKFVSRFALSYGLSQWHCHGCGALIKCEFIKIQTLWFVGMLVSGGLLFVLYPYFDFDFLLIFLITNLIFIMLTFYYIKFEKGE